MSRKLAMVIIVYKLIILYTMRNLCYTNSKLPCFNLKPAIILLLILSFPAKTLCQKQDSSMSVFKGGSYEKTFSTSRIGLAQSVMTTPKGEYHLVIQHRFAEIESGANNFFGMDGAIPRVGFDYGFTDWLSGGIGRSLFEKTFDLEFKALILRQNNSNMPVSISFYTSMMANSTKDYLPPEHDSFGSRLSFANQLFIARNQGIFSLQVAPLWLHSIYEIRDDSPKNIYALDVAGRIRIWEKIGFIAEYIPVFTHTPYIETSPLTLGIDINTGGHQFQLIFSNSQGLNEKSYLTNTTGSWKGGHIYFGFNLTRVFNPKLD